MLLEVASGTFVVGRAPESTAAVGRDGLGRSDEHRTQPCAALAWFDVQPDHPPAPSLLVADVRNDRDDAEDALAFLRREVRRALVLVGGMTDLETAVGA